MNKARLKKLSALNEAQKWVELETLAREYIKANKKDGTAWKALACALENQKKDAMPAMQRAIKLLPNDPQAYFNYGNALKWHGKISEAVLYYKRALQLKPNYAEAWSNLGNALQHDGEPFKALECFWNGVKIAPHLVNIQLNMGNCYMSLGLHEKGVKIYEMALAIKPDFIECHNAMLFGKDLMEMQTVDGAQDERRRWAAKFSTPIAKFDRRADYDGRRRIRVGYVSADIRKHSAARVFGGVLLNHDRSRFEVFAYNNSNFEPDDYMETFRGGIEHWKDIAKLTDHEVAELIRKDGIDVLVDLSGHSAGNRLQSFARRPAPVQITAWGYATATGMQEMDYFFADPIVVPPAERHLYVEEVVDLPSFVGAFWLEKWPEINDIPVSFDGNITFGSLNRAAKITPTTVKLWAEVLKAVPTSGMIVKSGEFGEDAQKERLLKAFAENGIPADRLIVLGNGTGKWEDHMKVYHEIDICLDPVPHTGGVTTLESSMMGVPVVTWRWPTITGRLSASILTTLGLTDWIAESAAEYVDLAVRKAKDLRALGALRQQLRGRFQRSILGDQKAYCLAVEQRYVELLGRVRSDAIDNPSQAVVVSAP